MHRFLLVLFLTALAVFPAHADGPLEFHLTFDKKVHDKPFTGRAYVMLFAGKKTALEAGPNWLRPEPFFCRDVKNFKPGEIIVLDKRDKGYPGSLDRIARGTYTVQAVIDLGTNSHSFSKAPGNVYTITQLTLDPATSGPIKLHLDRVYKEPPYKETDKVKLVDIESKLLTAFHKRPTRLRASVVLPASHAKSPARKYPVVYEIPGFSGNHRSLDWVLGRNATKLDGVEVIHVMLDPDCHHGHHVFADSATNGPCGKALIEELIPHIESKYRGVGKAAGRFVMGHSSGGWSSLWLQVTYPDFFGGCWSTAPDPVDFRDFQIINLYRPGENMFTDREGKRRPIARKGDKSILWYQGFSDMEEVMGHGGQLASFEACFSERGDGKPKRLWDRKTGKIDLAVAKSWEKYDIRLVLERNWKTLGPKLSGKIHVYMGGLDTFYLDGATRLLKKSLAHLKSDARVEIIEGLDHRTLLTDRKLNLLDQVEKEMAAKLRAAKLAD